MASGSQSMTTYYAKRIVGDASAAQANSALLQTGTGVTVDTWILNRTNRATTYGIKYVYDDTDGHDKVEFYGGAAAASAWVQLDTGDTYIAGKFGINYNPGTSGNNYQLYVNGSSYFTDTITGDSLSTWHILGGRPSNTTSFNTYFETIANLHHDTPARTDAEISYNRFFLSNSDQTNYGPNALHLPVVDQHVLSFGIDNGAVYSRHMAFDIRTNAVYVRARINNTWGNWEQLVRNTGTWDISITGNAATATKLSNTPNNTTTFLRGDNTWTNTLTGTFYSTGSPGFQNVTAAGTWAYLQLKSGTLGWDIASSSSQNSGALDFRPHKSTNHGIMISQDGELYFRNPATEGIYYTGTKATYRMIRFIDNTSDTYGNGISIGGGGQTIIGGGESANTAAAQVGTSGSEIMYVCNDGNVDIISNLQDGWNSRKVMTLNTSGYLMLPSYINSPTSNNENPTVSQFIVTNGTDHYYRKASTAHVMAAIRGSASGSWSISVTGSSASCTGNAATATNADKVDNYHASDLWRKDGGTWNGNANIACTPTANNQEYSFDLGKAYTGTYWHVWSGKNSKTILACYNDNMSVSVPNGTLTAKAFSGPLTGNVTGNVSGSSGSCTGNAATATSATYANYPTGFNSRATSATWGNQTGTTVTVWGESDGGAVEFRKNNPSSGKISIKVDGRLYGNEGNCPAMLMNYTNSYWGMADPDGGSSVWIRTTSNGIIPYQSGAAGSGHCGLGTSSWYFSYAYIDNIYGKLNGNCTGSAGSLSGGLVTNSVGSYGNLRVSTARGGYYGILFGATTGNLCVMSNGGQHNGLFSEGKRWILYYDYTNDRIAIGNSTTTANYMLTVNGNTYINGNLKGNNTKTIGTTAIADHWNKLYLGGSTTGSNAINSANPLIEFSDADRSQYGQLIYTDYDSVRSPDGLTWVGNQANSWFQAPRVFGAVWNDYAEYRETKEDIQPGRCVVETGNGDLVLSTKRLQGGCEIVSDTFGFAIGQTNTCKTPTACAGRVLAYLYEDNSLAKPGDPVCSGPNGTVSLMTHEEEIEWPSRIIATVSEIPTYDEWEYGSADEFGVKEKLKVNGRIWIRIR